VKWKTKKKTNINFMADKTMPPTEAPTPTTQAMPGEMAAPTPEMAAPADSGKVMVQMPSDAFDNLYTLFNQLASGLDALKAEIDAQKQGGATAPAAEQAMAEEMPMPADEDFLKSIAQEGSMR
jgi:hypothetical protein